MKNRKYARAKWHDYGGGVYFVTICTKKRVHYFGEICGGDATSMVEARSNHTMILSEIGKYVTENLQNITLHYPYAEIPLFVVMPNNIHAIIFIDGEKTPYPRRICTDTRDGKCRVAARHDPTGKFDTKNEKMQQIANLQGWLSVLVGGIKSAVTKFANEKNIEFAWQTRFDDRIIDNQNSMNRIADYIENNIFQWETDCFNNSESLLG